jgi:transcriptional regulator GlxA family with amidase domain
MAFKIGFVLFPDFEELDFAGPWEVLGMASKYVDQTWERFIVAKEREVKGFLGLRVPVDYTFADAPDADLIVVPGGLGTRPGMDDAELINYIKRAGSKAQWVTSVCTGAMLLHRAGFLEGRKATTHWGAKHEMAQLGGSTTLVNERWVQDGNVITAAGVSAGIDMALYVVGMLKGPEEARKVQKFMEYDPAPPYQDAVGSPAAG